MQRELGCIFVMSRLVVEMTVLHEGKMTVFNKTNNNRDNKLYPQ